MACRDLQVLLLYFLLHFPIIFLHIHPPKSCHFYLLFVKNIRTFLFPTLSLVTSSRSCYRKLICPRTILFMQ